MARPQFGIILAVNCALSMILSAQSPVTSPTIEQRIQRIQNRILSPPMFFGEPVGHSLAERMAGDRVPGVSIAVIHNGEIEWARGFGVTRIGGPPVTSETLFQAGSISKPVAALAVLRLVESGKLSLDDDVNQYLRSWKVEENDFTSKEKVTLRGLLTHTAGMTVHGFRGYATGEQLPTVVQILNGQAPANTPRVFVDMSPGRQWRYSGGGYVVTQLLLEDVTGKPFAQLMRESVLQRIGMMRSTYEQPLPAARIAEAALPHDSEGSLLPGGPYIHQEMAAAGLWTTPSDLARYAIEVQRGLLGKSTILSATMARQVLTPIPGMTEHGLGPALGGERGRRYFYHGGSNRGYKAYLVAYDNGDGAVVMTNSDNADALRRDIMSTIAHEYKWPDFQPKARQFTVTGTALLLALGMGALGVFGAVIFRRRRRNTELRGQLRDGV
jgi:CubicO group peptidase (beta-lactamase class C family)